MARRKTKTGGYSAEELTYLSERNASTAATLRREHPDNPRLLAAADVMDDWAQRYARMAAGVREGNL